MSKYESAFSRLRSDYEIVARTNTMLDTYSPIKKVRVLRSIHGVATETETDMHGIAIDGCEVDKKILVDDDTNHTDDDITLLDKQHHTLERYHNAGVTRLRCGLMTCVALSEAMKLLKINSITKVGFIGNGLTNIQNADCICDLFGVKELVIRGSARNRGKNLEHFKLYAPNVTVDDTDDYSELNTCQVIVSCTSTCDVKDQISAKQLCKPLIFIALDTGYLLNESFRQECEAYTDDIDQLNAYYDEEFAFDKSHYPLKQLVKDASVEKPRICVYMFGISFADAEVAEMVYKHDVNIPQNL